MKPSFYTLPKLTVRKLRDLGYIRKAPFVVEANQVRLINSLKSLSTEQKAKINRILEGYHYPLSDEPPEVRKGLDLALNYKIPREPNPTIRTMYFKLKKHLAGLVPKDVNPSAEALKANDPTEAYGDAHIKVGYEANAGAATVEGKFAQRDFYTSRNDGLANSYLEILKSKISVERQNVRVRQLTVFKLESLVPSGHFNESFNRLVDLSFYSSQYERRKSADETVIRIGQGASVSLGELKLGVLPYLGVRHFRFSESSGVEADIGIMSRLNYWLSDDVFAEARLTNYFFTAMPFKYKANLKMATRINTRWTLGLEGAVYEQGREAEVSFIYAF